MKLPHIPPVLPKKGKLAFDDPDWIFDLKYDGYRGVLYLEEGVCRLMSKQDKRLPFRDLEKRLAKCIKARDVILDGEVCSLDSGGWPRFDDLGKREGEISYVAFDILWLNGVDLREKPLSGRRKILEQFARLKTKGCLRLAYSVVGQGVAFYGLACKLDLEGIIAKRLGSLYSRRTEWLKIKNPDYSQAKGRAARFNRSR